MSHTTTETPAQNAGMVLLTTEETAKLLRCSPATLRSDICRRRWNVPIIRVGRSIRYSRAAVLAWLESQNPQAIGA